MSCASESSPLALRSPIRNASFWPSSFSMLETFIADILDRVGFYAKTKWDLYEYECNFKLLVFVRTQYLVVVCCVEKEYKVLLQWCVLYLRLGELSPHLAALQMSPDGVSSAQLPPVVSVPSAPLHCDITLTRINWYASPNMQCFLSGCWRKVWDL